MHHKLLWHMYLFYMIWWYLPAQYDLEFQLWRVTIHKNDANEDLSRFAGKTTCSSKPAYRPVLLVIFLNRCSCSYLQKPFGDRPLNCLCNCKLHLLVFAIWAGMCFQQHASPCRSHRNGRCQTCFWIWWAVSSSQWKQGLSRCIDLNSEELFNFHMIFHFPQLSAYHDLSSGILNPVISSCPSWCLSPVVGVISGLWK